MANSTLLILNGPGLADSCGDGVELKDIEEACATLCDSLQTALEFRQSDDQDQIVDWIVNDSPNFDALILNPTASAQAEAIDPGKYCSALRASATPDKAVCEVHLNNIFQEDSANCGPLRVPEIDLALVCGLGLQGYLLAIQGVVHKLRN